MTLLRGHARQGNFELLHHRGADLSAAILYRADFSGADLSYAKLSDVQHLSDATLVGTVLSRSDLSGADLKGADLRGADLTGADLSDAYLHGADFSNASLSYAALHSAYLTGADLRDAKMDYADLSNADLRGAVQVGTDFEEAILEGTIGLVANAAPNHSIATEPSVPEGGDQSRGWKCPEPIGYLKDGRYPERMAREGTAVVVQVTVTVDARGLIIDAQIMEEDESVFRSIDIAALAVARDCRFDAKRGAPDATHRLPITFDPRRR